MNRTIKFRGKSEERGKWVYGFYIKAALNNSERIRYQLEDYSWIEETIIPETVGQFTGLLDRNGKEIYEGDVFLTDIAMAVVEWEKEGRFLGFTYMRRIVYVKREPLVEVIGNIHDNPELLKNK